MKFFQKSLPAILLLGLTTLNLPAASDEAPVPAGSIRPAGQLSKSECASTAWIDLETALRAALGKAPGRAIEAALEVEDGTLLYSFLVVTSEKSLIEVEVDAGNGHILATEVENEDGSDRD